MTVMGSLTAAFAPDIAVRIEGSSLVLKHFASEYAAVLDPAAEAGLDVRFTDEPYDARAVMFAGGHKTVRWTVRILPKRPLKATIDLRGYPRPFGLSLVQGYFVEPLLSLVAIDAGLVLVPGAGIVQVDGAAILLLGRSGSGKSTLSARALAAGRAILGDDQVLLDGSGSLRAFPRRMRFYADLSRTSPEAYAKLSARTRSALALRRIGAAATSGFVVPPVRVPVAALGPEFSHAALPLARVVLIERGAEADDLQISHPRAEEAVELAMGIIDEQRSRIAADAPLPWLERLEVAHGNEAAVLVRALEACPIARYRVPLAWNARRAAVELGRALAIAP